jgi:uncharacterized protein YcbX
MQGMTALATLSAIRRYPVKSLAGEVLDDVLVEPDGIAGDRGRALVVRDGHARTGKTYRGKEHERLHLLEDAGAAVALAAQRGVALSVEQGEHFFDDAPISLILSSWIDELSALVGYPVGWERFRPNFFASAIALPAPGEVELVGRTIAIGALALRVTAPIERCVAVTHDPAGGPSDPAILRTVAQRRSNIMGIYCAAATPATVRIGDPIVLTAQ